MGVAPPGGILRWLMVNAEPVREGETGAMTAVVTSFHDITERHAAQAQLRKLSMAVEQCPLGIGISETAGRIEYLNDAIVRITGSAAKRRSGNIGASCSQATHQIHTLATCCSRCRAAKRGTVSWATPARVVGERYDELIHAAPNPAA